MAPKAKDKKAPKKEAKAKKEAKPKKEKAPKEEKKAEAPAGSSNNNLNPDFEAGVIFNK